MVTIVTDAGYLVLFYHFNFAVTPDFFLIFSSFWGEGGGEVLGPKIKKILLNPPLHISLRVAELDQYNFDIRIIT